MALRIRHLVLPGCAASLLALAWAEGDERPASPGVEEPYSAQLHVHGSFSEGVGSMDSHSFQAQDLGLDVIWWSDHDFRIASYQHVSAYGFEDDHEDLDRNEPWTRRHRREAGREKWMRPAPDRSPAPGAATYTIQPVVEGERAMRVQSSSRTPRFKGFLQELSAHRALTRRCLATDISFTLAVFPERMDEDARGAVEVVLSEHAPHEELPFTSYVLRYYLTDRPEEPVREDNVYWIPVPCEAGTWNRVQLNVTADAERGFPFTDGRDNTLARILFGVETRRGAEASFVYDDFRIRQQVEGTDAYGVQREVMANMAKQYPRLEQLQGLEISYESYHLNEFGTDVRVPDYDQLAVESGMLDENGMVSAGMGKAYKAYVTERLVREAKERGSLISYNHMFGAGREGDEDEEPRMSPEETLAALLETRMFDADILEVGYKMRGGQPITSHLWVWDQLALRGLWPVGDGVSDYHGGLGKNGWRRGLNNFVSWIWATSIEKPDLLDGLRAGRVFFGDLTSFDGRMDVVSDRGFRMGRIVLTDRESARVQLEVQGLADDDLVKTMVSGAEVAARTVADGGAESVAELQLGDVPAFCRFEVYDAAGEPKLFSNPLIFVRGPLEQGLVPARAGIDVGGLRSTEAANFSPTAATRRPDGAVVLSGTGTQGRLVLDASEFGAARVRFEELTGKVERSGDRLTLSDLEGRGRIVVEPAD